MKKMKTKQIFPTELFVSFDIIGGKEYFEAQKALNDFSYDDTPQRKVAMYKLEKVLEVRREIMIDDSTK